MLNDLAQWSTSITCLEFWEERINHRVTNIHNFGILVFERAKVSKWLDNWICYISPLSVSVLKGATFNGAKEFCEILLNRSQIHFVKTKEERYILMLPGPGYKLYKWCEYVMWLWYVSQIAHHIHWVMPVRLYLYQFEISWCMQIPSVVFEISSVVFLIVFSL